MSQMQAHHCMTPEQRTRFLCSVNVIQANQLFLQELNQLIESKLLTSGVFKIFVS